MNIFSTPAILLNFPDHFETERLQIRLPLPGDGKQVHTAIEESLDELKPWMPFAHLNQSVDDVEQNLRNANVKFLSRTDMRWMCFLKENGELAVSSGLHRMDWETRRFEIGYWVRTKYAGQGLVTEAVKGIEAFAIRELQANRIEIRCDADNVRSAKIAQRLGYTLEGILRKDSPNAEGTELRDTMVFAKVRWVEFE